LFVYEHFSGTDGWITAWRLDDGKIGFIRKEHFTRSKLQRWCCYRFKLQDIQLTLYDSVHVGIQS